MSVKLTRAETGLLKRRMEDYRKAHKMAPQKGYQALIPVWGGATKKLCLRVTAKMGRRTPIANPDSEMLYDFKIRARPTTPGHKALRWLGEHRVYEGSSNNRGAKLDSWWREYARGKSTYIGQPWCGLTVWQAFYHGAGIDLREATIVYTPSVTANARAKKHHVVAIQPSQVREGDIVLFDWAGYGGDGKALNNPAIDTDHIAIARGPIDFKAGTIKTREGNTPAGTAGDQSGHGGGDGVYDRVRAIGYVICYARVVR